jgi:hypothetical protein
LRERASNLRGRVSHKFSPCSDILVCALGISDFSLSVPSQRGRSHRVAPSASPKDCIFLCIMTCDFVCREAAERVGEEGYALAEIQDAEMRLGELEMVEREKKAEEEAERGRREADAIEKARGEERERLEAAAKAREAELKREAEVEVERERERAEEERRKLLEEQERERAALAEEEAKVSWPYHTGKLVCTAPRAQTSWYTRVWLVHHSTCMYACMCQMCPIAQRQ